MILRCEYYMYALLHSDTLCILLNVATEDDSCAHASHCIFSSLHLASDYPDWYHDRRRD